MEKTEQARASGAEVLYERAELAWSLYILASEASKKAKGQDSLLRRVEEAAAFVAGLAWGAFTSRQEEILRIRIKRQLNMPLTRTESATWTLYGPKD